MWVRERTASSSLEVGACDGLIRLAQGNIRLGPLVHCRAE
jgi:hypothetical protein